MVADRWTFQIVEDYDAHYWATFRAFEARAREELAGGDRHVHEARMKQRERTAGHPRHEAGPALAEEPPGTTDRRRTRDDPPTDGVLTCAEPRGGAHCQG